MQWEVTARWGVSTSVGHCHPAPLDTSWLWQRAVVTDRDLVMVVILTQYNPVASVCRGALGLPL